MKSETEIEGESDVSGGIVRDTEKTERTRGGRSMKKIGQVFLYDISHIKKM